MIRRCDERDFEAIWSIINDGAEAYRGVVPADRLGDPYMGREKLADEIADGVAFWGYEEEGALAGVMGIQQVQDVTLIRHAYVRTARQGQGIGARLLAQLRGILGRLDRCPYGAEKTTCVNCPTHCYKPAMRDQVQRFPMKLKTA